MGLAMASQSVGNWLGGVMPGWVAAARGLDPMSPQAYGGALVIIAGVQVAALVPLLLMRMPKLAKAQRTVFAPISYARQHPRLLGKLIAPILITSIGAGLIMPFMNVFFREQYGQPDRTSVRCSPGLAMGIVRCSAAFRRMGKIQLVVVAAALSIRSWYCLAFAVVLAERGGVPGAGADEHEHPGLPDLCDGAGGGAGAGYGRQPGQHGVELRLGILANGRLGCWVRYGFGPPFALTILPYAISVALYWAFFCRTKQE
jgi:hypothetical protein